jgi:hypothetical protein
MKYCSLFVIASVLSLVGAHGQTVVPTNEWVSFWGDSSTIDNQPLPIGSVVRAYDPQGVLCGQFTVTKAGSYGFMSVYRDDPTTTVDEGATPGDTIHFTINGVMAQAEGTSIPLWTSNGDVVKMNLKAEGAEIFSDSAGIAFGTVALKSSVERTATIRDNGLKPLVIDSICSDYHFQSQVIISKTAASISPGDSLSLTVNFSPLLGSGNVSAHIFVYSSAWNQPKLAIPLRAYIQTDIHPTNSWISFWGDSTFVNQRAVISGDVIDAYDPQGVHCGTFTVIAPMRYGLMPVYFDDSSTPTVDEGVSPGDKISFTVNGFNAYTTGPNKPICTANGSVLKVNIQGWNDNPPGPFHLISPTVSVRLDSTETTPVFCWTKAIDKDEGDSVHYQLSYSSDSLLAKSVAKVGVGDTFYAVPSSSPLKKHTRYFWSVCALDRDGFPTYGSGTDTLPWSFDIGTIVFVEPYGSGKPYAFALHQNYPNPFNPYTKIRFDIPQKAFVDLTLYDPLGRRVAVLVNEEKIAGSYSVGFDASNLPSGIYFCRMVSSNFVDTKKLSLIK